MIKLHDHQLRVIDKLNKHQRGQVIVPTGGGKTLCMITDAKCELQGEKQTLVVVAPRILLAQQLSSDFLEHLDGPVKVMHVHSGDSHHYSTTNSKKIFKWVEEYWNHNKILFTTYHSLHKIQEAGIPVNTIYFDEAHNSVQRHFHPATRFYASVGNVRCYFFTATPKHSYSDEDPGMNNEYVYGKVLEQVPAPELVDNDIILPPKVVVKELDMIKDRKPTPEDDADNILATLDEQNVSKILICARRTTQITNLISDSKLTTELYSRGYNWMYITSKTGAVINGIKVSREEFFKTLRTWGKDDAQKFIVMHHSILSEGISVPGLEAALFLRNMDFITISQTIGRVIRKGNEQKQFGIVCVPVYDRVGISTAKNVTAVVDTIFNKGEPAISR
jgi:superfamily II DNA or RNA helicase